MSNNNQVSFKIDSRLFYTLIAILAVVGIFGIGIWIGNQVTSPQTPSTASSGAAAVATAVPGTGSGITDPNAAAAAAAGGGVVVATAPAVEGKGGPPVSPEKQPVGKDEPRLAIEELSEADNFTFDMGNVPTDTKSEKEFTLKNVGTSTLVIENTSASCGCTAAVADKKELAPGETTTLHVGYDPRVNQDFGKFIQKQVRIKSNDPVVPLAEFTITANVAAQ
jgi:hypothetical protein